MTTKENPSMDLDELERLAKLHGVEERPWELNESPGFSPTIFGRHPGEQYDEENLPCRITTGGDFDDLESARLAVAAVNSLPALIAAARRAEELERGLNRAIAKIHDFDQLGPFDDSRFGEVEADLRATLAEGAPR